MSREYTSAAKRANVTPKPTSSDAGELLAWVGTDPARARQALRDLDAQPTDVAGHAAREPLVEALLAVFPWFTIDGVKFYVAGEMQLLDLCELMRLNKRNVKTIDPTAIAALADFFRGALGEEEYERFRDHTRSHCTDPDVLNDVMEGIVEDLTDRPTLRPSHSVPGPSTSGLTSRVVSLSRGTVSEQPLTQEAFQEYLRRQEQQEQRLADALGLPTTQGQGFTSFG